LLLGRVYVKKLSLKSPRVPDIFTAETKAETQMDLRSDNVQIDAEHVEVTLSVTVRAVAGAETLFEIETVQAGIFRIAGFTPRERVEILGRVCPETLFPFVRKTVDAITRRGGFPDVDLRPLDFQELFVQNMRERGAEIAGDRYGA
jgi:preprotein translocase subunit SecB